MSSFKEIYDCDEDEKLFCCCFVEKGGAYGAERVRKSDVSLARPP